MRHIKFVWTQRNLFRALKWLRLECDYQGFLLRDGVRVGYKSAQSARYMCFTFFERDKMTRHAQKTLDMTLGYDMGVRNLVHILNTQGEQK